MVSSGSPSFRWQAGLLYCAAVWGATFYLIKDALAGVHPVALVGWRFLLSAGLLVPWLALRRPPGGLSAPLLRESVWLAALLLALYVTQTWGLRWTTASNSGFITALFVLFVPLLLYLTRGDRPGPAQGAAVAISIAGLWLLTGGVTGINRGDAITLVAAVTYAAHLLVTDRCVRAGLDTAWLAFHQFWVTGVAALALAAALGYPLGADRRAVGVIAFLALVPTISAFFVQMAAQRHVEPLRVTLLLSMEPVFAAAFAWTLGGEPLRPVSAAGGGLIVAAMLLSELSTRPPSAGAP